MNGRRENFRHYFQRAAFALQFSNSVVKTPQRRGKAQRRSEKRSKDAAKALPKDVAKTLLLP
jgi:hypothetical protein